MRPLPARQLLTVLAALAGAAALVGPQPSGARSPTPLETITPQAGVVSGRIVWRVAADDRVERVSFLVDGILRWTSTREPHRYAGRGGFLDTRALRNGTHRLVAIAAGRHRSWRSTTTVRVANGKMRRVQSPIYWGAFIEGAQTYAHAYGGSWGNAPWDAAAWDRFEANAGKPAAIVHYGQPPPWERVFDPTPARLIADRGAIPLMDMSSRGVSLSEIAAGRYDDALAAWARAAKRWRKPFFLRWNWEMNGTWFPWGAQARRDPAAFVGAWRRFHDVVQEVGATNVTWVWCPNLEYGGSTPYERLYPGDAYVDWTCLDGYNSEPVSVPFRALYGASYRHLRRLAPTKPVMIAEIASREYDPGVKAAWIADTLAVQLPKTFPSVKAVVWFNWRIEHDGVWWTWPIESSPSSQAAFRQAISSSYFLPGDRVELPALAKVPPPP